MKFHFIVLWGLGEINWVRVTVMLYFGILRIGINLIFCFF